MPTFKLPKGYSFTDPDAQSITVPDKGYGGADISQAFDAQGTHYVACNAWGPGEPSFKFRAFKAIGASKYVEVPLPFLATGRGEIAVLPHDGALWAIAWTGENFFYGKVAGFVPFPSLVQRIAALEARLTAQAAAMPPNITGGVLSVPAQGGIEGGEIILAGGGGQADWHIDVFDGRFRIHVNGKVAAEWAEP